MRKNALFIFCFGVFVIATVANAQTYQWVDDHGVVHLSDSPPLQDTNALVEIESHANFKPKPPSNLPSAQNTPNSAERQRTYCGSRGANRAAEYHGRALHDQLVSLL